MNKRLTYLHFRKILSDSYSEKELIQLFRAVKKMDDESKSWVVNWIEGEGYPDVTIEKVDMRFLVSECKFKPINAFIILDWLKNEPETAKYCLQRYTPDSGISASELEKMKDIIGGTEEDSFDAGNEYIEF